MEDYEFFSSNPNVFVFDNVKRAVCTFGVSDVTNVMFGVDGNPMSDGMTLEQWGGDVRYKWEILATNDIYPAPVYGHFQISDTRWKPLTSVYRTSIGTLSVDVTDKISAFSAGQPYAMYPPSFLDPTTEEDVVTANLSSVTSATFPIGYVGSPTASSFIFSEVNEMHPYASRYDYEFKFVNSNDEPSSMGIKYNNVDYQISGVKLTIYDNDIVSGIASIAIDSDVQDAPILSAVVKKLSASTGSNRYAVDTTQDYRMDYRTGLVPLKYARDCCLSASSSTDPSAVFVENVVSAFVFGGIPVGYIVTKPPTATHRLKISSSAYANFAWDTSDANTSGDVIESSDALYLNTCDNSYVVNATAYDVKNQDVFITHTFVVPSYEFKVDFIPSGNGCIFNSIGFVPRTVSGYENEFAEHEISRVSGGTYDVSWTNTISALSSELYVKNAEPVISDVSSNGVYRDANGRWCYYNEDNSVISGNVTFNITAIPLSSNDNVYSGAAIGSYSVTGTN